MPILVLKRGLSEADHSRLLSSGASDVLPITASPAWLRLRVMSMCRHAAPPTQETQRFVCGPLTVDAGRWEAWMDGHEIALTRSEFSLLLTLVRDPSRVVTRPELARAISSRGNVKAVEAHISRLRRKVLAVNDSRFIEPVRGVGYRLGKLQPGQKVG